MDWVTSIVPGPEWNSPVLFQYHWPLQLIVPLCHRKCGLKKSQQWQRTSFEEFSLPCFPLISCFVCPFFFFLLLLLLFPAANIAQLSVNKGRMKKRVVKKEKRTDSSCLEGCLIKGKCLFSAVEQQSLSSPNTNIAINFNFLHLFGHQRADRNHWENKAIRVSRDLNGLWTQQCIQFAWMTQSHACGSFLFLLKSN